MEKDLLIEYVDIDQVKLWEENPRLNEAAVPEVLKSIKKYGFLVPIVVGKNMVVKAGNTRVKAARKLGLRRIPIVHADHLTEKQINEFALADNKTSEIAEWDLKQVSRLISLDDLKNVPGFAKGDLDRINFYLLKNEGLSKPEKPEETPAAPDVKVKVGDIWDLGGHFLACGDSTDQTLIMRLKRDFRPNLMVTDPPYGVEYDPLWRDDTEGSTLAPAKAVGTVMNDTKVDWSAAWRLYEGDVAYVWHAGKFAGQVQNSLENVGFEIKSQIVWVKQNLVLSRGHYHWKHEPCWYAIRKGKTGAWNGDRKQSTVWEINNMGAFGKSQDEDMHTGHSTQKPLEAMARPILNNSKMGDYVYDPFVGSGTTIIACEKLERRALAVELNPVYCQMAINRWEKFTGKTAKRT